MYIVLFVAILLGALFAQSRMGGEVGQCYFVGGCVFDEYGRGYRYYQCTGAYTGYGGWEIDFRCRLNESRTRPWTGP